MLVFKKNKKILYVILSFVFLFQLLNIGLGSLVEKPDYYDNCETTFHDATRVDFSENIGNRPTPHLLIAEAGRDA